MKYYGLIYKAQNLITNEVYIGATTKSIKERKVDHVDKSSRNEGGQFQAAIATYGCDAFDWVQIDTANDANELARKEKEYIVEYDSIERGYNSDSGGGIKKKVYQFDLKGNMVAEYESLKIAASVASVSSKRISNACLSNTHLLENHYWSYEKGFTIKDSVDNRRKEVYQYNLDGEFIANYTSVAEASKSSGLSKTSISRACRGERKKAGGYIWKYN